MTSAPFLIVGFVVVAAAGTIIRALTTARLNDDFYYGTLAINLLGSFLLGALADSSSPWAPVLGVAGLGALTTWSTLAEETTAILRRGEAALASSYLGATVFAGVLAAWIGLRVGPIL